MADEAKMQVRLIPDTSELKSELNKEFKATANIPPQGVPSGGTGEGDQGGVGGIAGLATQIKSILPIAAIAAGVAGIKKVLDVINEHMEEMKNSMKDVNPALQKQEQLLSKIMNMALLPMSQLLTQLMRPYLMLMLNRVKKQMKEAAPTLKKLSKGEISFEEAEEKLMPIFKKTTQIMGWYQQQLQLKTKKITGAMAGYQEGVELVRNTWISGAKEFASTFKDALTEFKAIPPGVKDDIDEVLPKIKEAQMAYPEELDKINQATEKELEDFNEDIEDVLDGTIIGGITGLDPWWGTAIKEALDEAILDPLEEVKIGGEEEEEEEEEGGFWDWLSGGIEDFTEFLGLDDFLISDGQVYSINPNDTVMGYRGESPSTEGGNEVNVTVNVSGIIDDTMVTQISKKIRREIDRGIK